MGKEQMDKHFEQNRVDSVVKEINQKVNHLSQQVQKISSDALEIRKTFWNDVTVNVDEPDDMIETYFSIKQQAQLLSERERSQSHLGKELKTLGRLKYSPYFGRVDFKEDGEQKSESIYLGITSLMDQNEENFLIYDWRAPISSIYYDYSPGKAEYNTLEGNIKGEMELKRQFIIRNSKIEGMFDTGITIGDEILQEVLGNNANTQMKSIVATIQKEQNQIIRNEKSKVLLVQGVAGSGKTSAALQRVAYLLYRYRGILTSQNIMLFSPNPLFNSYVATVLPELGEENMQQATFLEYLTSRIEKSIHLEDAFMQVEYILNGEETEEYVTRIKSISFKSNLQFKEIMDQYLKYLSNEGLLFKDIMVKNKLLISAEQIKDKFYTYDKSYSIPNRMALLQEWLLKEIRKFKKREREQDWVKEEIQFLEKEDYLDAFKKLQKDKKFNEDTFDDQEREEKVLSEVLVSRYFKPIIRQVKKFRFIDYIHIYNQLFTQETVEKAALLVNDDWKDICRISQVKLSSSELTYEDATPFVYLKDHIEGRKGSSSVKHVFIDEAQDYSPLQFAYIRELFPYSKMTLLGDINQGIFAHSSEATSILPLNFIEEDKESIILTRSYRSTRPIGEFTKSLLKDGSLIEPFNREGNKPTLTIVKDQDDLHTSLVRKVNNLKEQGHKTIAIICKTAKESQEAFHSLKDELPLKLIEKGTISFEQGVLVIPSYLAKGIEFDAVLIYDASSKSYHRESERRLFYTACTRAMHELHLYTTEEISPLLSDSKDYLEISSKVL
ncbi:RNA polymerase recycling motor HelD [Cytobacillus sp. FJAT-54145]|uniref:RNA polymerase recycling motor HelD n=1 Tax=Cytobacillus spartinae TaxID=3299023 RepID=A0ABW6K541_9BACI